MEFMSTNKSEVDQSNNLIYKFLAKIILNTLACLCE